ncbi:NAD(P)-binding domain-containing protein [Jatrophihabitans sp. YIM 134969]
MNNGIWILGATGRAGRGIARRLVDTGHEVVLAGRDPARVADAAAAVGDPRQVTGSLESVLAEAAAAAPPVVVNTVGPFARTAAQVVGTLPAGTHYVDIGNELGGVEAVLNRHDWALEHGNTLVAGAGFGVLATEATVLRLCENRPAPTRLRVDAIPSLASEGGVIGEALAGSMLGSAHEGGRRVAHNRLVRAGVATARQQLTTPSGDVVTTSSVPTGDLLAAWRASGAEEVVSGSSEIPSGPLVRAAFPVVSMTLRWPALRRIAVARLARTPLPVRVRPREFSWGHAWAQWADGSTGEMWLRLADAGQFYEDVAAETARRVFAGVRPGAHTPGVLFGATFATELGAEFVE